MSLTRDVKEFAHQIGFQLVGISAASHLPDIEAIMAARIREGLMGDLGWFNLERVEKACNPSLLLPSATSVLTLAVPYFVEQPDCYLDSAGPKGRISRYAWSLDYHDIMRKLMQEIEQFLKQSGAGHVGVRAFVDSGPIAEREFARRSGVGWFGKNANVLTPKYGSWVFLGEIVTDLELESDSPLRKSCGNCDRCVKSCPTGAIISPYTIDASRCISYLTIELKGAVPRRLRPLIGDWIFGCDVCQEVCPVNNNAIAAEEKLFPVVEGLGPRVDLFEILEMNDDEYRARFRSTPLQRAKKRGLQRNAAVALGNCGDPSIVPLLVPLLGHPEELVRGHVVWALGELGGRQARRALETHRSREFSEFVLQELEVALGSLTSC